LLLARDEAYQLLSWVVVAPLTTTLRDIPSAVLLDPESDGVDKTCAVSLDNLTAIPITWLGDRMTILRPDVMLEVDRAIRFAIDMKG